MDDYPNNPSEAENWVPEKPEERVETEQQENTKVTTSLPVIEEVLAWFEERAKYFNSAEAIDIDVKTSPEDAKQIALTCKHLSVTYDNELSKFRRDFAKYLELKEEDAKA